MPRWQQDGPTHWALQPDFPGIYPLARVYKNHSGWVAQLHHNKAFGSQTIESKGGFPTKADAQSWAAVMSQLS